MIQRDGSALSEHIRRFVQELALAGYQLDRSAFDYLKTMEEPEAATIAKSVLVKIGEKPKVSPILTKKELLEMTPHASIIQISVPVATRVASKEIIVTSGSCTRSFKGAWNRRWN